MKKDFNKIRKIVLFIFSLIGGGTVILFALAYLLSIFFKIGVFDMFSLWQLYVIWIAVILIGTSILIFDIRIRGSKRILKVNKDLEDSHFMTMSEISKNKGYTITKLSKLGTVDDGIPVYAKKVRNDIKIVLRKPIHTLLIGTTGTGKTTAAIEPTLEILCRTKTKPSIIITDPKGELYMNHAEQFKKQGYTVNIIDLSDVYHSTRWNPFNDIWHKTDRINNDNVQQIKGKYYFNNIEYLTFAEAEEVRQTQEVTLKDEIYIDLQDLIYTICPIENKQESSWEKGARDLILALAVGFWEDVYNGYMPREKFNLYNIYRTISDYAKGDCEELIAYFNTRSPISKTRGLSNTVLVAQERTLTSFLTNVSQYFSWMADTGIAALTSGNDIEFNEFDEKPNVLYLKIPDEKENRYKLITLFMTQMYKALVEKANENVIKGKTTSQELLRNVYFVMDEFGNMPKFHNIDKIVTVGRSRRIFLIPVLQDYNKLIDIYGREVAAIIKSNCNIQIYIGTKDENTRREFSESCGKKKVKQISYSENKDMSISTSAQSVPLIYPNELEHLNDPNNKIFGNAIITCLGSYPIRAKFTPFFEVKTIYNAKTTELRQGAFNNFDENAIHYDINKYVAFIQTEEMILNENTQLKELVDQKIEKNEQTEEQKLKELNKRIKLMLAEIQKRLLVLKNKIPKETFDELNNCDIKSKLVLLDRLSETSIGNNNFILSATCEQIRNFILHRCFTQEDIEKIERECALSK